MYGQLVCTSINSTSPEVNNHVSLQWPSYKQPHGSNLRSQREQTSWFQALTIGPLPKWLKKWRNLYKLKKYIIIVIFST